MVEKKGLTGDNREIETTVISRNRNYCYFLYFYYYRIKGVGEKEYYKHWCTVVH